MDLTKKWHSKKKSLGHINAEMEASKNYQSTLNFRLNGALKSTTTTTPTPTTTKSSTIAFKSKLETKLQPKSKLQTKSSSMNNNKTYDDFNFPLPGIDDRFDQAPPPDPRESAQAILNHNKAVSLLRTAIAEGGGKTDPKKNFRLNAAIKRGREIGVPQATLQQIIRKFKLMTEARPIALLQIRYQRKIYIICTVLTRSQSEFQLQLQPTLKKHFAGFAPVLNFFDSSSYIEAIVPMNIGGNFLEMKYHVKRDSEACGALSAKIKDYETGTFRFYVDPLISADVAAALINKGYRIVDTAYEFTPKRLIEMNTQERDAYYNFLWKLRQIPEIDGIFDNVKDSVAN